VNALRCAQLLALLAVGTAVSGLVTVFYDPYWAIVLAGVALLYTGAGWLAMESHRSVQELVYRERRSNWDGWLSEERWW
jgi:hypothetical protein